MKHILNSSPVDIDFRCIAKLYRIEGRISVDHDFGRQLFSIEYRREEDVFYLAIETISAECEQSVTRHVIDKTMLMALVETLADSLLVRRTHPDEAL